LERGFRSRIDKRWKIFGEIGTSTTRFRSSSWSSLNALPWLHGPDTIMAETSYTGSTMYPELGMNAVFDSLQVINKLPNHPPACTPWPFNGVTLLKSQI
jgi:hypothetical protein